MQRMINTVIFLVLSAILGVVSGSLFGWGWTTVSHTVRDWTFLEYWQTAIPIAITFSICLGLPATILFRHMQWRRWWQFAGGAALIASPCYLIAADELGLAYFSCSATAGVIYWWLSCALQRQAATNAPQTPKSR